MGEVHSEPIAQLRCGTLLLAVLVIRDVAYSVEVVDAAVAEYPLVIETKIFFHE
jgi:hypothetical protein